MPSPAARRSVQGRSRKAPRLTHILVQVRPRPGSRNMKFGGAFINCWISYPDIGGALAVAKHYLRSYGWIFVRVAEYQHVMRSDYRNHPNLPYFDEAAADGASFVVHTFPKRRKSTGAPVRGSGTAEQRRSGQMDNIRSASRLRCAALMPHVALSGWSAY